MEECKDEDAGVTPQAVNGLRRVRGQPHKYIIHKASTPAAMTIELVGAYSDIPPARRKHELYEGVYYMPEVFEE